MGCVGTPPCHVTVRLSSSDVSLYSREVPWCRGHGGIPLSPNCEGRIRTRTLSIVWGVR